MYRKILFLILCILVLSSCKTLKRAEIEIHFLDVGQADASLILTENSAVMIDCGNSSDGDRISSYLDKLSVKKLDLLIITHPHEDHVGSIFSILENFKVEKIIIPEISDNNEYYKKINDAIKYYGICSEKFENGLAEKIEELNFEFVMPLGYNSENMLNDSSGVVKLMYQNISVLFVADIQRAGEGELVSSEVSLRADVIKVPHHGGADSSGYEFLMKVMPEYAIISCGRNNPHGHPAESVLTRYAAMGCDVYRTDIDGAVVIEIDGDNLTVRTDKNNKPFRFENAPAQYAGNKLTRTFHHIKCKLLPEKEKCVLFENADAARNCGYTPCLGCIE